LTIANAAMRMFAATRGFGDPARYVRVAERVSAESTYVSVAFTP
jgi:hypothetical protein